MPDNDFIALIHPLGEAQSVRLDFKFDRLAHELIDELILDGYKVYQFIDQEFTYLMEGNELKGLGVQFETFKRVKKTWFGLSKKEVCDFLIYPEKGFYYPYSYGHYFYLFSKAKISGKPFFKWLDSNFSNHFSAFDYLEAGHKETDFFLLHKDDYILVTNHDFQSQFGITAKPAVIEKLMQRFRELKLEGYEESPF